MGVRTWFSYRSKTIFRTASSMLLLMTALPVRAELWRSPLHTMTYIEIEKRPVDPLLDAEQTLDLPPEEIYQPLPASVAERLGSLAVDYPGSVATYLPASEAAALIEQALAAELFLVEQIDRRVELPWHAFVAGEAASRDAHGWEGVLTPAAVPGLYLVQFAYPIQEE